MTLYVTVLKPNPDIHVTRTLTLSLTLDPNLHPSPIFNLALALT